MELRGAPKWPCAWRWAQPEAESSANSHPKRAAQPHRRSAGLAIAYASSQMILALAFPRARNMPVQASPSLPVLGFAFLVSLLTGIIFGIVPAWLSSKTGAEEALRGANRSTGDRSSLPQKALIVLQVTLSVVLLSGAFLTAKSLANLQHQNFGIATANRYTLRFDPQGAGYSLERLPTLYRQIEQQFSALPSTMNVSLARYTPLDGNAWGTCIIQQGHPAPGPGDKCFSSRVRVEQPLSPVHRGAYRARTQLLRSRHPDFHSGRARQPILRAAILSRPGSNRQAFGLVSPKNSGAFEIVGVFADFKMNDPRGEVTPLFLRPLAQQYLG